MAGCKCDHTYIIEDPGNPTPCEDCLYVTSHVRSCDIQIAVAPCGDTGDLQVETNCQTPTYSIIYYDPAFASVSIDEDGVLSYETSDSLNAVPETYYEIRYKVTCGDDDFEGLSVIGTATICIANLCRGVDCDVDEECNPCTGLCEPAELNLGLTIS